MKTIKFNSLIHDESQRCKTITQKGKCEHLAVEGVDRCSHHGANRQVESKRRHELDMYNLDRFKFKVGVDAAKTLFDEVLVLKVMLGTLLDACGDSDTELIIRHEAISNLVLKIEKCVTAMTKLEIIQQTMVDKHTVERYVARVLEILTENIEDKKTLNTIAFQMQLAFEEATKPEDL